MNDILLSFNNVTIRSAEQISFSDISFELREGQHHAFIGENESLKNALLYAMAGKAGVTNGKTSYPFYERFLARNVIDDPLFSPYKLIALVGSRHPFRNLSNTTELYYQQRYNSLDAENSLTVFEYLSSLKAVVPEPEWTLEKVTEELHLRPHLDKRVIQLSNGETKRVLIAAAILRNPVLLLLDNPLTGLDIQSREDIQELINHLAQSGITIAMSTTAGEIPEAITHITVFERDGRIKTQIKSQFQADAMIPQQHKHVDETEIRELLSFRQAAQYKEIVCMKNISVQYGDRRILDSINWTIRQGERWALLGHNGAGKSTLLSLINGDNPQAYANDIILFDRKRGTGESIWDIKSKTGFVSAELYQYFPVETSCLHAVESGFYDTLGLFRRSIPANKEIAFRWMKLLGIGELSGKLLKNASPGDQRLCLLARALVKNPPLLILDEPCQGMDHSHQSDFRHLLDAICTFSNLTLIYVTHYRDEIPGSVTRLFKLENGRQIR